MKKGDWVFWLIGVVIIFSLVAASISVYFEFKENNQCNYDSGVKNYVGKSGAECSRIRFSCAEGLQYFSDLCGCGCEKPSDEEGERNYCLGDRPTVCTKEYNPVCGWNDPAKVQCIRYPCAQTYGNGCEACGSENVLYWTKGECPA